MLRKQTDVRRALVWICKKSGMTNKAIADAIGEAVQVIGAYSGHHDREVFARATIREGVPISELLPHEQRLYRAQAIPIRDFSGWVRAGDCTYSRRTFWDVEMPPDNWLTRHKERDPRAR